MFSCCTVAVQLLFSCCTAVTTVRMTKSILGVLRDVHYNSIFYYKPTHAHNCHIFTIIYLKHYTPTCFEPYWSIIREYINCRRIKQLLNNIFVSSTYTRDKILLSNCFMQQQLIHSLKMDK